MHFRIAILIGVSLAFAAMSWPAEELTIDSEHPNVCLRFDVWKISSCTKNILPR